MNIGLPLDEAHQIVAVLDEETEAMRHACAVGGRDWTCSDCQHPTAPGPHNCVTFKAYFRARCAADGLRQRIKDAEAKT